MNLLLFVIILAVLASAAAMSRYWWEHRPPSPARTATDVENDLIRHRVTRARELAELRFAIKSDALRMRRELDEEMEGVDDR